MGKKTQNKNNKYKQVEKNFDISKFTFLRDLLLIKAIRATTLGLIDPVTYEDKPEFGEIIKLGKDVKNLKVGNIVRFGKYSTEVIRTNGEDYYIVHEEDISAVL